MKIEGSAETVFGWMRTVEPAERITETDVESDGIHRDGPVCAACGKGCRVETVDVGVGAYEYWGAVGYHSQLVDVSDCCEAEMEEW